MFFLIYVSSAVELFSDGELFKLLETSRKNNEALGITGMLLYKDGNFMQFLEGERKNVVSVHERISKDRRHTGLITLLQEEETQREFSDFAMGFRRLGSEPIAEIPGYSDVMKLPLSSENFVLNPSQSLKLFLYFKQLMG